MTPTPFGTVTPLPTATPPAYNAFYVDNEASGENNGSSWEDAWQKFSDIYWSEVLPGDVIYISGGEDQKIYYEQLTVNTKGEPGNNVTIRTGQEPGHNGMVIIDAEYKRYHGIHLADYELFGGSDNVQDFHLVEDEFIYTEDESCINTGEDLTELFVSYGIAPEDKDGIPRAEENREWDIGAFEFEEENRIIKPTPTPTPG